MASNTKSDAKIYHGTRLGARFRPMSTLNISSVAILLVLVLAFHGTSLGDCDSCLAELNRNTSLYDRISISDSNRTTIRGTLVKIDLKNSLLTLSHNRSRQLLEYEICRDKVSRLGFRKQGKPNIYLMVAGFFVGQIAGKLVEEIVDPSYQIRMEIIPFRRPVGNEDGTWAGAIAGLGAGLLVPMMIPAERTVTCYDHLNTVGK